MKRFIAGAFRAFGAVYIPDELIGRSGEFLLHVSDTPSSFFPDLNRIISKVRPLWVVHTGDLVDQVKLGLYPSLISSYRERIPRLSAILDRGSRKGDFQVVISLGNHDDSDTVEEFFPHCHIIDKVGGFSVHGWSFKASHYSSLISGSKDIIGLFGHDLSSLEGDPFGLNGIKSVNLFSLKTGEVYEIPYPRYIDDQRQMKRRIGL
nr:metallophosphoesterase [uncultured Dethiosulfovibrio sp.]